ncbi:hypothetical protein AB6A40_006898 [Gnathostoma spinigerum]|uniref:G protein-coupled receptor n=1 Tax=Gnathostoma spinigerum TaxID=75299 RepID=A0ABD6EJP9_9BILA
MFFILAYDSRGEIYVTSVAKPNWRNPQPIGSRILRNLKETWNLFTSFSFLWPTLGHFARRFRIILDTSFLYIYVQLLLEPSDVLIPGTITFTFYVITCCSVHSPLLWAMWPMLTDSGPLVFNCVLTIATIINCINMLIVGRSHPTVIMVFLLIENTFCRCGAEAVYCCFSSAVATRNDRQNTKRKPTSATFNYALRTVITNPAEQLGFILVLLSLSSSSYPNYIAEPGRYGEKCPPLPIARLNYTQRNIGNTSTSVPIFEFDQTHINKRSVKLRSLSNDSIDNIQRILLIDMDINQQESSTTKERERRAADTTENHRRLSVTSGYGVTQRRIFSSMVTQSVPQTAAVTPNSSVTVSRKYSTLLGTIPPATPILNLDHFGSNKHSEYLLSTSTEFKPVNTILGSIEKIETSTLSEESSLLTPTTENTESRETPMKRTNEKDTSSTLGEGITTTEGSVWTNESDVTTIMPSTEPQQEVKPSNYTFVEEEFYYDDETTPSIVHYKFSYSRCQGILDVVFLVAVLGPLLCAFIELIAMYLYRRYFHFQRNLRVKRLESSTEVL